MYACIYVYARAPGSTHTPSHPPRLAAGMAASPLPPSPLLGASTVASSGTSPAALAAQQQHAAQQVGWCCMHASILSMGRPSRRMGAMPALMLQLQPAGGHASRAALASLGGAALLAVCSRCYQ